MFHDWDYQDEGYSLRWDPIEDQAYALRWRDPSKSRLANGPGTMAAANYLAVEALRCFPVFPIGNSASTTGFHNEHHQKLFKWPIWMPFVGIDTVRSLLSLPDLRDCPLPRSRFAARGIAEVFGVRLVRPNQYYSNFAPALPIQ